jgi:hypothetical protein
MIARWKGLLEEIHFGGSIMSLDIIENFDIEKPSFRPSKWPRRLKPTKNSKLPKLSENCFELVRKRWVATDIHLDQSFMAHTRRCDDILSLV